MKNITIWHNPKCSKSREAMSIIEDNEVEVEVFLYLQSPVSVEALTNTLRVLNLSPLELMRTGEDIYGELNLQDEQDEQKLIEAMSNHPILIQRPLLVKQNTAIIGRPTSIIQEFITS